MTKSELFSKFKCPNKNAKILALVHTDPDGSGPAILLNAIYPNVTVQHCPNKTMSYDIKNAICNNEVNDIYDIVIACDISCTEEDALKINNNPHKSKLIILDHHPTALHLNKYNWACVHTELVDDSYRTEYYNGETGLSSGTSLMYDFLDYFGMLDSIPNIKLCKDLIHRITSWDTWDWFYKFGANPEFKTLPTLFGIYGSDRFEEIMLKKIMDSNCTDLFDDTDKMLLELEDYRIETYLQSISKCINTGNITMNDTTYSCVFCTGSQYLSETFEFMKETYKDYDLYIINYGTGISFRACKEDINVAEIVKPLGGGGHPGAGGTKIPFELQTEYLEKILHATLYVDERN